MLLRPVSLGLGWLFLSLALIHFISAKIGRGGWLIPAVRPVIWVLDKTASFFEGWKDFIFGFSGDFTSDIAKALALLFMVILMPLPCLGVLAIIISLVSGSGLSEALGWFIGLWAILHLYLLEKKLVGVLIVLVGFYLVYEIGVSIIHNTGRLIEWSAEFLSKGEAVRRQLRVTFLFALLGAAGLGIGFQAPTREADVAVRLTPTSRPTSSPEPTSTPPVNLSNRDLSKINLSGDNFDDANLRGANLFGTNLNHASLLRANLRNARLAGANLEEACLDGADLRGADMTGANLASASLRDAILSGANLRLAVLYFADFSKVDLSHIDLRGASLNHTWLTGANLRGADLTGADLRYAFLSGADLTGAQVEIVQILDSYLPYATMPDGTRYDGRFHTRSDDAKLDYLLDYDGLDPSETLELGDYLDHYGVSKEIWVAGRVWASEHLKQLQAESDAWYAEYWPDD